MVAEEEVVSPVQVEETVDVDRQIWENQQQLLIQLLVQIHLLIGSKFVLNQRYVFCCKNGISFQDCILRILIIVLTIDEENCHLAKS